MMRLVTVSVLAMVVCGAAFGDARLPVVNIGAGAVSARAAFGEGGTTNVASVSPSQTAVQNASRRTVTARPAKSQVARAAKSNPKSDAADTGAQIALNNATDILVPHRPSGNLWAVSGNATDVALRMPRPDEISVIRSDDALPEEFLDTPIAATRPQVDDLMASTGRAGESDGARSGALDAEIAKLVAAQRQADAVARASVRPVASTNTGATTLRRVMARGAGVRSVTQTPVVHNTPSVTDHEPVLAANSETQAPITESTKSIAQDTIPTVHRMVVPMDPDVVVRQVHKSPIDTPVMARASADMTAMSPSELKKAFRKTYLSENKHLSTFQIDDRFDVASDMDSTIEGFTASRDLSESGGVRPLEIKIKFRGEDASLSRENYNLLSEYAAIVLANPKRAVQVSIPESVTRSADARKLAARRLAIVEQVLRDTGVSEHRIMPVLAARDEQGYVLRMISNDQFETLTQKKRDMFGDTVGKKTYKSMTW